MATASQTGHERPGRRSKFGERTIKREFRIPESMDEQLITTARERGDNLSDVMYDALKKELRGDFPPPADDPVVEIKNMISEMLGNPIRLQLGDRDRGDLLIQSRRMGYRNETHFLEDLVRRTLESPREIEALLAPTGHGKSQSVAEIANQEESGPMTYSQPLPARRLRNFQGSDTTEQIGERFEEKTGAPPSSELINVVSNRAKARKTRKPEE